MVSCWIESGMRVALHRQDTGLKMSLDADTVSHLPMLTCSIALSFFASFGQQIRLLLGLQRRLDAARHGERRVLQLVSQTVNADIKQTSINQSQAIQFEFTQCVTDSFVVCRFALTTCDLQSFRLFSLLWSATSSIRRPSKIW